GERANALDDAAGLFANFDGCERFRFLHFGRSFEIGLAEIAFAAALRGFFRGHAFRREACGRIFGALRFVGGPVFEEPGPGRTPAAGGGRVDRWGRVWVVRGLGFLWWVPKPAAGGEAHPAPTARGEFSVINS